MAQSKITDDELFKALQSDFGEHLTGEVSIEPQTRGYIIRQIARNGDAPTRKSWAFTTLDEALQFLKQGYTA